MVPTMWSESVVGGVRVLACDQRLTCSDRVEQAVIDLERRIEAAPGLAWVIDGHGVEVITSEAIAVLIRVLRKCLLANGQVALARPQPLVRSVVQTLRLHRLLPVHEDVAAAVAALSEVRP